VDDEMLPPLDAAEDYRQQLLDAAARKSGVSAVGRDELIAWANRNVELLGRFVRQRAIPGVAVDDLVSEYLEALRQRPDGGPNDDINTLWILSDVLSQVERAAAVLGVPGLDGVAYGAAPEFGLQASQQGVYGTEASIISVTLPFLPFCNMTAKLLAISLIHGEQDGQWRISNDSAQVLANLKASPDLIAAWCKLLAAYAVDGRPPDVMHVDLSGSRGLAQLLLLRAIEVFVMAHEYGHHALKHGRMESSEDRADIQMQEHEADLFARAISLVADREAEVPNMYLRSGVGGVVILGALDLVRRAHATLRTGSDRFEPRDTHPPFEERVAIFGAMDQSLPAETQAIFADLRGEFAKIVEGIWQLVLPILQDLHRDGVLVGDDVSESDWLPTTFR
jgi:hypothetical protein